MSSPTTRGEVLVEARRVVKAFPGVWEHLILDHIDFDVRAGEVHALLGENGAGKTVLANILSGFYTLSEGEIRVRGRPVKIKSPLDAIRYGIGMVHQEFTLVPSLTVAENIALSIRRRNIFSYPVREVATKVRELSKRYGLRVDPDMLISHMSLGEQQRVEILKVLFWEPNVLILDEPTSVLTLEEANELFKILRRMADEGKGVVFITHRIEEIMRVADRVTVLRLGKKVGTLNVAEASREQLLRMMIGEFEPFRAERKPPRIGEPVLEIRDLHVCGDDGREAVRGVSFTTHAGEIFGIAGVAGNGQRELVEAITGLRKAVRGRIIILGQDATNKSPREVAEMGVRHIPEERRRVGVAEAMCVAENMMLRDYNIAPFSKKGVLDLRLIGEHSKALIERFKILAPDIWNTEVRILSGGNIQRLILARELWRAPKLVIAFHPTYGLDLKAVSHTHDLFMQLRDKGSSILLVSEDLEEILTLSDRIGVMYDGRLVGVVESEKATTEVIGKMMTGM